MNVLISPSRALAAFLESHLKPGFEVLGPEDETSQPNVGDVVLLVTSDSLASDSAQKLLGKVIQKMQKGSQVFVIMV